VPTPAGTEVTSMEELAARIVPTIHESHRGPVIVAGWSLAGVVAIEVAAQLERAGTDVRAVVLFDTLSPVRYREWFAPSPRLRQWQLNLVKVRYHLEEAMSRGVAGALRYLVTTARDARARTHYDRVLRETAPGGTRPFDVPLDFRNAFGFHAARYNPSPLNARLVVVRPERQKRISLLAGDLGWARLGYQVEMIVVPGDHERMFAPANAPVLAERLLEALAE
jgi:thioesterase domain-containing protein